MFEKKSIVTSALCLLKLSELHIVYSRKALFLVGNFVIMSVRDPGSFDEVYFAQLSVWLHVFLCLKELFLSP